MPTLHAVGVLKAKTDTGLANQLVNSLKVDGYVQPYLESPTPICSLSTQQ